VDLLTIATSADVRESGARTAVLPIGSFEQHGSFLPLITDTVIACAITHELEQHFNIVVLPPVTVSCSHEHSDFAGTISVSARTLQALIGDIAESAQRSGLDRLILVNGHGGNYVLSNIVQETNAGKRSMSLFPSRADWDRARADAGMTTNAHEDMHAGELEVSVLLHVAPELVGKGYAEGDWAASERPHLLVLGMRGYTETGVIGRPSVGSADKGRLTLGSLMKSFQQHLSLLDPHFGP
jgi:creatinine amidohydrolase